MQGDDAEYVDALLLFSLQPGPQDRDAFGGLERGLVLEAYVGGYLAEQAGRLHGRLRVYENAPAAEHVLVKREQRGSEETQDVRQVERRVVVHRRVQCVEALLLPFAVSFSSHKARHAETKVTRKEGGAHPIAPVVELLAPPVPLARAAQIRAAHTTLIEEPPRWRPVFLLQFAQFLWPKRIVYSLRERFERGEVSPGTRAHGAREEDAKGGEAEAALALLGGRAPVEDTDAASGVLGGEVTVWWVGCVSDELSSMSSLRRTYMTSRSSRCRPLGNALNSTPSSCTSVRWCVSPETRSEVRCAEMEYRRLP